MTQTFKTQTRTLIYKRGTKYTSILDSDGKVISKFTNEFIDNYLGFYMSTQIKWFAKNWK